MTLQSRRVFSLSNPNMGRRSFIRTAAAAFGGLATAQAQSRLPGFCRIGLPEGPINKTILLVNQGVSSSYAYLFSPQYVAGLQAYFNNFYSPVYGTRVKVAVQDGSGQNAAVSTDPQILPVYVADHVPADNPYPGSPGYHFYNPLTAQAGVQVGAADAEAINAPPWTVLTHETAEAVNNPADNLIVPVTVGSSSEPSAGTTVYLFSADICDAVRYNMFTIYVNGACVAEPAGSTNGTPINDFSDFLLPAYFNNFAYVNGSLQTGPGPFDSMQALQDALINAKTYPPVTLGNNGYIEYSVAVISSPEQDLWSPSGSFGAKTIPSLALNTKPGRYLLSSNGMSVKKPQMMTPFRHPGTGEIIPHAKVKPHLVTGLR